MLMPRNTCETFCANCISGTWLALTLPRHLMPLMKPSDFRARVDQFADELVVRLVLESAG